MEPNTSSRFAPLSNHNVTLPDHLLVRCTKGNLLTEFRSFSYDGEQFFGTAFIQGNRLQFTTAMPFRTMLKISKLDRADPGSTVDMVREKANRPKVASHGKLLRQYLQNTACLGEKFIMPALSFNFGDEKTTPETAPDAILYIYADEKENGTNGWPALFQLPREIELDTTDGAHRADEIQTILNSRVIANDERQLLGRNACDVKIIFEKNRIDAHQDFADCAKAKPITGSLIATFDIRDVRNSQTVKLVKTVAFLQHYVDATAANVNLSAGSVKIWSMSAMRGFVGHVQDRFPPKEDADAPDMELEEMLEGVDEFFTALVQHMPQLHDLDLARMEADARKQSSVRLMTPPVHTETPAKFRNKRGGNVALRGIGLSLFARAFLYAKEHGMSYGEMAQRLAQIDWHLFDCEREDLPKTDTDEGRATFAEEVRKHTNPIWASLLVIGENRYKIGSSNDEANAAWARIVAKVMPPVEMAAAAE